MGLLVSENYIENDYRYIKEMRALCQIFVTSSKFFRNERTLLRMRHLTRRTIVRY